VDDYYNGWWIKVTSGTGASQVRKIKAYDGATRIATIHSSSDQVNVLSNPTPLEGLDFLTVLDITSSYALYPCHYVMCIWDESHDEFAFICSNQSPSDEVTLAHYSNVHVNDLQSNAVYTNMLNGSQADITVNITLNDGNTTPVTMTGLPNNYGIYQVFVRPLYTDTRCAAIFIIGRVNSSTTPGYVTRLLSVKGAQFDALQIQWRANEYPELFYSPKPIGASGTTTYKLKIVTL
jgi:hypothetical protein